MIDCLLIGYNEMDFREYEKKIQKMGITSGAYRDLDKNFLRINNTPYHLTELFNIFHSKKGAPHPFPPIGMGETFSLTIAYLASFLHHHSLTFEYVHVFQEEKEHLAEILTTQQVLTVAITTTLYVSAMPVLEILQFIKRYNQTAKIIIGGPFVSNQLRVLDGPAIDYLFHSLKADFYVDSPQGESALVNIIHYLKNNASFDLIKNTYYLDQNTYKATPVVPENNLLTENPVNWPLFAGKVGKTVSLRTSTSCPFSCSFCGFPEHAGEYRTAPIEAIENELNLIQQLNSVTCLHFIDDTFNVPLERFKNILRMMIKNRYPFRWYSHFRCQFADDETLQLMKDSGCIGVFLGIESGNDTILQNMNKKATVRQFYKGVELLNKYGILSHGSFIIGFPGETDSTVNDTLTFIKTSGIDMFRAQLWYCDTVTPIWKKRDLFGIEGSHFQWSHATMNSDQASDWVERIFLSVDFPLWIPQYNFEFNGISSLLNRGISLDKIKQFIRAFNSGVREKYSDPPRIDASLRVIKHLEAPLFDSTAPEPLLSTKKPEPVDLQWDFNF